MTGIYEIQVRKHFSAAHSLREYDGPCKNIHGHNWIIDVTVKCKELNEIGIGIDFKDIKTCIKDVFSELDHSYLNDTEPFKMINPTSENIAKYLYQKLGEKVNDEIKTISKVTVSETPGSGASYYEE